MERLTNINSQRVAWCCADLGLSPDEVAAEAGLAPAKLKAVIDGEGGLTFGQLRTLADYFGRSVLFFLEPGDVNAERLYSPQFRTLTGQKPDLSRKVRHLVQRAEQQRAVYQSLLDEMPDVERPRFTPPPLPASPVEAAKIARDWLGLGETNTFDTFRAAVESKGILVFRTNGYAGKWQIAKENPILGFALFDSDMPVIVVKKQNADARQSFTLMHELGHILLHSMSWVDDEADMHATRGKEREANQFAAHVLVPDAVLARLNDADRPTDPAELDAWIKPMRKALGVSADVLLLRLAGARRLPQTDYEAHKAWRQQHLEPDRSGGTRAYRHREPTHVFGDRFVRTVLSALGARQITLNKASDYLDGLTVTDLHKLERFYAGD